MEKLLAIVSILGFLGTLPQFWGSSWRNIWLYYAKGKISWDIVHKANLNVLVQLKRQSFVPTSIVGVGRGGAICTGILCSELVREKLVKNSQQQTGSNQPPSIKIYVINSKIYLKEPSETTPENPLQSKIDKIEFDDKNITFQDDEKILIIVAQEFRGDTLRDVLGLLRPKVSHRGQIKTIAVFWHKAKEVTSVHDPDLFGRILHLEKTMPWKDSELNTDRY